MVSLGLLVLRAVVGGIFAVHGYAKVFGGPGKGEAVSPEAERLLGKGFAEQMEQGGIQNVAGFQQSLGLPYPKLGAIAVSAAELGGGLALILGWRTRLAALSLLFAQGVAVKKVHAPHGLLGEGGFELSSILMAATAGLALAGPGALALDALD